MHVVYGHPAMKTHAKCVLVVRREGDGVRNYVHIGTGNYHSAHGAPLHRLRPLHNRRGDRRGRHTSCSTTPPGVRPHRRAYRKVLVAPSYLRKAILGEIEQRWPRTRPESPSRIDDQDQRARRPRPVSTRSTSPPPPASASTSTSAASAACAPGLAGRVREHPRRLRGGAASSSTRASTPSPTAHAEGLHLIRRPDAAQPRQPRRAGRADRGPGAARAGHGDGRAVPGGQPQRLGPGLGRRLGASAPGPTDELVNAQETLMRRHSASAAEA